MDQLDALLTIALDLTAALDASDRYQRLLDVVRRAIPCDAAALLKHDGDAFVPAATYGLTPDLLGRRFVARDYPRLDIISKSAEPVRFPTDTPLPDPFDGFLVADPGALHGVHACLGCPLRVQDELVGLLTADALTVSAFDAIDPRFLSALGALAGAAMRTTLLVEALEHEAERRGRVARDLMRDLQMRQGSQIIGVSPVMEKLRQEISLVARSDFTVLVAGETGVGKELVARAVHAESARRDEPMLYVNCAALPESLADSELFGHAKGAFTGATADRPGKFEVAHKGTLFLDEIGELPLSIQPKLLRALQDGEIQRVGRETPLKVDVRLIAATNRDLEQEVRAGRFRADLFHRLNVFPLRVPPLRERKEDIALLSGYFCDLARRRLGLGPVHLAPETLDRLRAYPWPGNVRELENVVSRAALKAAARTPRGKPVLLEPEHLGLEFAGQSSAADSVPADVAPAALGLPFRDIVQEYERSLIRRALDAEQGNWAAAARRLGLDRGNLHHLAKRLGLR